MRDLTVSEQSWNNDATLDERDMTLDADDALADATYSFSYARI